MFSLDNLILLRSVLTNYWTNPASGLCEQSIRDLTGVVNNEIGRLTQLNQPTKD